MNSIVAHCKVSQKTISKIQTFAQNMIDTLHDWFCANLILGISGIEHYQKLGVAVIIY